MPLDRKKIKEIIRKNKEIFETLEAYDQTRQLPFQRKRIDITLSVRTINKLKMLSNQTNKTISRLIEERI